MARCLPHVRREPIQSYAAAGKSAHLRTMSTIARRTAVASCPFASASTGIRAYLPPHGCLRLRGYPVAAHADARLVQTPDSQHALLRVTCCAVRYSPHADWQHMRSPCRLSATVGSSDAGGDKAAANGAIGRVDVHRLRGCCHLTELRARTEEQVTGRFSWLIGRVWFELHAVVFFV